MTAEPADAFCYYTYEQVKHGELAVVAGYGG